MYNEYKPRPGSDPILRRVLRNDMEQTLNEADALKLTFEHDGSNLDMQVYIPGKFTTSPGWRTFVTLT